jgi:hypothetical protein
MKTMINTNGSNGSESKMAVQSGPIVLDSSKMEGEADMAGNGPKTTFMTPLRHFNW